MSFDTYWIKFSWQPGLPDGIFKNPKSQFGLILEGLGMENVATYLYYMSIWNIIWPFGILYGHLVI
jgi:hypothetical protein